MMLTISRWGVLIVLMWFQSTHTMATFAPSSISTTSPQPPPSFSPTHRPSRFPSTLPSALPTMPPSTLPTPLSVAPTISPTTMPTLQCPHAVVGCREYVGMLTTLALCETTLVQVRGRPTEGRGLSIAACDNPPQQSCVSLSQACPCHCLNSTQTETTTETTTPPQTTTLNISTTVSVKCNDLVGCDNNVDKCATGNGKVLQNNARTVVILCDHNDSSECSALSTLCPCTCGFPSHSSLPISNGTTPTPRCSGDEIGCVSAANHSMCDNDLSLFNVIRSGFGRTIFTQCNATGIEDQAGDFECKTFNDICRCACIKVAQAPPTASPMGGATTHITSSTQFDSKRCETVNNIVSLPSRKLWCSTEAYCVFTKEDRCTESISHVTQPTTSTLDECITNECGDEGATEHICLDNYECNTIIEQLYMYRDVVADWPKVFSGLHASYMNASVVAMVRCVVYSCATNFTNDLETFLRPSISPTLAPTMQDTTSSTTAHTLNRSTTTSIATSVTNVVSSVKTSSRSLNVVTMSAIIVSVVAFTIFFVTAIILYRQRQRYVNLALSRYEQVSTDFARNDMFVLNTTSRRNNNNTNTNNNTDNNNNNNDNSNNNTSYDDAC